MFYYVDISKIEKLDVSQNIKKELSQFIYDYYDRYSGIYLKSRDFLQNLERIWQVSLIDAFFLVWVFIFWYN